MRVLFLVDPGAKVIQTGYNIQIYKTIEYLQKKGIDISVSEELDPSLKGYDLVHVFSYASEQFVSLLRQNVKYVMSPVYCDKKYFFGYGNGFSLWQILKRKIKLVITSFTDININVFNVYQQRYAYFQFLKNAAALLPNSNLEKEQIFMELNYPQAQMFVVPNGADESFAARNGKELFVQKYGLTNFILLVGRIEPHKNQKNLLKAVRGLKIPIVLVGQLRADHEKYYQECRKIKKDFLHIPELTGEMLVSAYQNARVHVLPSYFETTGLVTLEALLAGTRAVSTDRGYAREYFENYQEYCNPDSIRSIRKAITRSLDRDISSYEKIKTKILKEYTWQKVAEKTLLAYQEVLKQRQA